MKKIFIIFAVLSAISFGNTYDVKPIKDSVQFEYDMGKKAPWGAVAGTFLLPSLGHAYAGNWGRGLGFLAGELLVYGLMINAANDNVYHSGYTSGSYYSGYTYHSSYETGTENDWMIGIGALAYISLRIWEHVDAYKTAKNYNANLYRKLTLDPVISVENKTAGIKLSYNF